MTIDIASTARSDKSSLRPEDVPLREGPPTREELLVHYPALFTWTQMKAFVNSGDLGLLKRDKKLQKRYDTWAVGIRAKYGSMVNYLLAYRLQWGQPDRRALLPSALPGITAPREPSSSAIEDVTKPVPKVELPEIPPHAPPYFTADAPPELISVIMNDWPYSVPPEIEHVLIWTRLPIIPTDLPQLLVPRIQQDGLWGFTGNSSPPPSPSVIPQHIHALADWGITVDKMIRSPKGTDEEEAAVKHAGRECEKFIKERWIEREWETAWFVNPPRLQSVPGLAHIHVFARKKSPEEIAAWR